MVEGSAKTRGRLETGTVVDARYEVTGFLGAGGFAVVYAAMHRHIQRPVALKILNLPPELPNIAEFEARFLREAQTAARVRHPHVVEIFDFGFHGPERKPYIAMELLEGGELADALVDGGMAPDRVGARLVEMLRALAAGHELGVVHKDLKPANLFLVDLDGPEESARVLDYGVARLLGDTKHTATGQVLGTPSYMAPEYIKGSAAVPQTDVYQMGLVMVEMLTGEQVVQGNPIQCVHTHCTGELQIPTELLDGALGPVLVRALALEPSDRYSDAAEFADAVEALDWGAVSPTASSSASIRLSDTSVSMRSVSTATGADGKTPVDASFLKKVAEMSHTQETTPHSQAEILGATTPFAPALPTPEPVVVAGALPVPPETVETDDRGRVQIPFLLIAALGLGGLVVLGLAALVISVASQVGFDGSAPAPASPTTPAAATSTATGEEATDAVEAGDGAGETAEPGLGKPAAVEASAVEKPRGGGAVDAGKAFAGPSENAAPEPEKVPTVKARTRPRKRTKAPPKRVSQPAEPKKSEVPTNVGTKK